MGGDYQFFWYTKSDRDEVFDFIRSVHSPEVSARLITQWDWKYTNNPFNRYSEPKILLLKDGSQIAGFNGDIFFRATVHGRELLVHQFCDLVIHPDYRGLGLSRRYVEEGKTSDLYSFSWLNEASRRSGVNLRTDYEPRIVPLVKPMPLQLLFGRRAGGHGCEIWSNVASSVARFLSCMASVSAGRIEATEVDAFDDRMDVFWQRVKGDYPVILVRDLRYLRWRFMQRPDVKYRILLAMRGEEVAGYMVFRSVQRKKLVAGYLVDFLVEGRSLRLLSVLAAEAVARLRKEGATFVICLATDQSYRKMLHLLGFLPWYWGAIGYLAVHADQAEPKLPDLGNTHKWFLTLGDGDIEMAIP